MFRDNSEEQKEKCLSKIAYSSKSEALARASALRAVHGTKLYPYLCKYCGCYHLATDRSDNSPWGNDY